MNIQTKRKIKTTIDIVMVILLPLLMSYSMIGETAHEMLGLIMTAAFISHHVLNYSWQKNLFKGKYTKSRIIYTVTDFALLIIMLALPISGIAMSKHILVSAHFGISAAAARRIHILAAYWGFVLMSFHAGLHIRNLLAERVSRTAQIIFTVICAYGLIAFIKRDVAGYLLMRNDFAFFDFNEPAVYFILDYAAIMCLFAGIGCCLTKFLKRKSG